MKKPPMNKPMLALLRRVCDAGKADGFRLREVFPVDATSFDVPLDWAIEAGLVERVTEGCGRWFYRLTPCGKSAAAAGRIPQMRSHKVPDTRPEPRAQLGYTSSRRALKRKAPY